MSGIRGIDVSNHQAEIDWKRVAADRQGIEFAFIKATEGLTFTDKFYARNRRDARANGIAVGAYHFARTGNDPEDEAERFLRVANIVLGDLRPVLDIEDADGNSSSHVRNWILSWCGHVAVRVGVRPFIYTYPSFATQYNFAASPSLAKYPLWIANYEVSQPTIPRPWKSAVVWQDSSSGKVAGVRGRCDMNYWLAPCDPFACHRTRDSGR